MTVTTTTAFSGPYTPDGLVASFPFTFAATDADQVQAFRLAVDGSHTILTGFSVVLSPDQDGGTVLFDAAPAVGDPLYIASSPDFEQQADFLNQGNWSPEAMNQALDRAAARDIYLKSLSDRSLRAPEPEALTPLPSLSQRRNTVLAFDSNGNPTTSGDVAKGDPGGNVMAIGLFQNAPGLTIPTGTDVVRTAGFNTKGVGIGDYVADAAVDAAYVAAHPLTSFITANARGFRLVARDAMRPDWFGFVEGDNPANGAANSAAMTAMLATCAAYNNFRIQMPPGVYWFASSIDINIGNLLFEGASGGGLDDNFASVLKFPSGVTGIRVQNEQSSGAKTKDASTHSSGGGTVLRDLALQGSFATTETEAHGVQLRRRATLENLSIKNFEGDGIYISASLAAGDGATPPYGNDNCAHISRCTIFNCRNGFFIEGQDANACSIQNLNVNACRQWGIWGHNGFENTYHGGQLGTNGITAANDGVTIGASLVSSAGNVYGAIAGQEAGASTNAPSGTTADNNWWYYIRAGAPATGIPGWSNGMVVRAGGSVRMDSLAGPSAFFGVHVESDQGKAQIAEPSAVFGGTLATQMFDNPALGTGNGGGRFYSGLDVSSSGASAIVGPMLRVPSGAVDVQLGGFSGNTSNRILDMKHATFGEHQFEFSAGLGSILFCRGDGSVTYFQVTTASFVNTFGRSAVVTNGFNPLHLYVTDDAGSFSNGRQISIDTAAPSSGPHGQGDISFRRTGANTDPFASRCITAGTPGAWQDIYSGLGVNPIGYVTGAGGAVTQATSKATGVTLNKLTGQITMNAAALASAAKVSFVVTNSQVAATDTPVVAVSGGGTANAYRAAVTAVAAGSFTITVENITGGSLSEAPVINFSILKGVAA